MGIRRRKSFHEMLHGFHENSDEEDSDEDIPIKRRESLEITEKIGFRSYLIIVLFTTLTFPCGYTMSMLQGNVPLSEVLIDKGPVEPEGSARTRMQQILCFPMVFLLCTHFRALWYVPPWTKDWNIVIDFCTSTCACILRPSAWGISYITMHGFFGGLRIFNRLWFRGLFATKEAWRIVQFTYHFATLFEVGFQVNHIVRHFAPVSSAFGLLSFVGIVFALEVTSGSSFRKTRLT